MNSTKLENLAISIFGPSVFQAPLIKSCEKNHGATYLIVNKKEAALSDGPFTAEEKSLKRKVPYAALSA